MDTDALRLFVYAAKQLNISAAGRTLGMAPAASSAKLAKLEKTLGTDLLHRSTRKVALSQDGLVFLPYAQEIIAQEDAALGALGREAQQIFGILRFTAPSSFAQLYIAPLLPAFMRAHPNIEFDLRFSDSRFDLIEGSFDLALRNAALESSSLKGRKLADDMRVLCAAPAYLEQFGVPVSTNELSKHRLIAFQTNSSKQLRGSTGETGTFEPSKATGCIIVDDGTSQRELTIAGAGISINSLWSVHADLQAGRIVRILPSFTDAEQTALWLIYPKTNVLSAKVRTFMDFLIERIGKRPPWQTDTS